MISRNQSALRLSLHLVFVVAALALFQTGLRAQLKWEATTIRQELQLGQEAAEALFHFENAGKYPVVIRDTSSSCGCTTAKLDRTTYYPGDKGVIVTRFDVGERTGTRRNTVQVMTDDPLQPVTQLTFSVEIPVLIDFSPRLVFWRQDEEPVMKRVKVQLHDSAPVRLLGAEADQEGFTVELAKGARAGEYFVQVTPQSTKAPDRAIISLQTEPKVENRRNFSFYAYVR